MINSIIKTDSGGTSELVFSGTGASYKNGGIALDGSTPVAGQITGVTTIAGDPAFTGDPSGVMVTKAGLLTENGADTSYTLTIPVPAGAVLHSIKVIPVVLWDDTGSATLKVGDTADDDGYFTGVNIKATDALVGEILETNNDALWGGKNGAYLVAATGRRGPTTSNFGMYYEAGSNITFIVIPGNGDGTAGRTYCSVTYSVGEVLTQVAV